jgi:hypothetical protein
MEGGQPNMLKFPDSHDPIGIALAAHDTGCERIEALMS